jgi:putative transcriptional regulator
MTDINDILKIKTNDIKPAKGKILISEPFLMDYYFKRSVVLLAEHNTEGTFGLILNKQVEIALHEVLQDFPEFDAPVYLGGPVKTDSLYFIHTLGDQLENSLEIINGLYWGGDIENVKEMITFGKITTKDIKFFVGYSGWVSKQLDAELARNSWLVASIKARQVMEANPDRLWKDSLKKLGGDYAYWTNFPSDPVMN